MVYIDYEKKMEKKTVVKNYTNYSKSFSNAHAK